MDTFEGHLHNEEHVSDSSERLSKLSPGRKIILQWKGPLDNAITAMNETQFRPHPSDIILVSYPKTGTTWLKALTTSIINFHNSKQNIATTSLQVMDPLLTQNPHQLVPFLEIECFGENPSFDLRKMTSTPRVFNTHFPYWQLPESIKKSGCKMVYITRNPMDTFVSMHFFYKKIIPDATIEDNLSDFCQGIGPYGSYFDHVLEYWQACNERPNKLLFLTYEELKQDPRKHVKRLAEFLGYSLDPNEVEQVVERSSFDRLRNLKVNKDTSNIHWSSWDFSSFFRRGVVNDARNHLTPDMVEQLVEVARQKWEDVTDLKIRLVDKVLG